MEVTEQPDQLANLQHILVSLRKNNNTPPTSIFLDTRISHFERHISDPQV